MARGCEVLVCLAGVLALSCGNSVDKGSSKQTQDVVMEARKNCVGRSSGQCAYFDFLTLLGRVLASRGYQSLSHGTMSNPDLQIQVPTLDGRQSGVIVQMVNHQLADRMFRQLAGWSRSGNSTWQKFQRVMDLQLGDNQQVQRGRKLYWWKYLGSLLLTIALTLFSALISKALTLATISLLLSLLGLLGGLAGLGGSGGGGHGHSSPPLSAYRSPATIIAPGRHPGVQYEDELDDPANPFVYVNRKNWKTARSEDYDRFYKYHYEQ